MIPHMQPESSLQHIRAITLDLDDTLWEIGPVIRNAEERLKAWLEQHYPRINQRFSSEEVLDIRRAVTEEFPERSHDLGFLRRTVLERMATGAGYEAALAEEAFSVFYSARNEVDLYPDVLPHLERLHARFAVVAVTNGNANLETIGIRHLFHGVVTATDAGVAKPARRIFDVAVEITGVSAREVLHVGDHPEADVRGAQEAGLTTAWINRAGHAWPEHLESPDATVVCMGELWRLLEPQTAVDA
jgi:putative hydrolase of the HAD superfamily